MDNALKSKISGLGGLAAIMGFASIVLSIFNYNLRLLVWIDAWGETMGWIIRIALIVGGLAIFFLLKTPEEEVEQEKSVE